MDFLSFYLFFNPLISLLLSFYYNFFDFFYIHFLSFFSATILTNFKYWQFHYFFFHLFFWSFQYLFSNICDIIFNLFNKIQIESKFCIIFFLFCLKYHKFVKRAEEKKEIIEFVFVYSFFFFNVVIRGMVDWYWFVWDCLQFQTPESIHKYSVLSFVDDAFFLVC